MPQLCTIVAYTIEFELHPGRHLLAIRQYQAITASVSSSGQPARDQFREIRDAGFELVINLALATSDHALVDESEVVTGLGMDYIHIPVVWEQPEPARFSQFARVMLENRHRKIWVHCALNMRVSAFLYLYHVHEAGWQEQEARALLDRIWEPNATWRAFMTAVAAGYAVKPGLN
jgi:protein tyrosine phosphatase (PTP) superfamily phosphohydrolase (DUF442 family)